MPFQRQFKTDLLYQVCGSHFNPHLSSQVSTFFSMLVSCSHQSDSPHLSSQCTCTLAPGFASQLAFQYPTHLVPYFFSSTHPPLPVFSLLFGIYIYFLYLYKPSLQASDGHGYPHLHKISIWVLQEWVRDRTFLPLENPPTPRYTGLSHSFHQ